MNNLTFKVQLTPTQSKRFQKKVFAKGGTWVEGETTVILTMNPFMVLQQGKMCTAREYDERYFQNYLAPEVLTEQAFKLVAKALPLEKPSQGSADEHTDPEESRSDLITFLKKIDEIHETILEMESKNDSRS